jgi:hypothetical protein
MIRKLLVCRLGVVRWATLGLLAIGTAGAAVAQPDSSPAPPSNSNQAAPTDRATAKSDAAETGKAPPQEREQQKPDQEPTIPSLDQMLAMAFDHNPDVAFAAAQLKVAEAELDRTRLGVAQKIIAFRQRWQTQRAAVAVAEQELRLAEQMHQMSQVSFKKALISAKEAAGFTAAFEAAQQSLALERERLTEMRAELPFLLGRPLPAASEQATAKPKATAGRSELLRDALRPLLKKLIDASTANFRVGRGTMEQIYEPSLRLMKVERELASTEAERIAAIETHRDRMKQLRAEAEALSKGGLAGQDVLLATQVYVAEADLALLEERAND